MAAAYEAASPREDDRPRPRPERSPRAHIVAPCPSASRSTSAITSGSPPNGWSRACTATSPAAPATSAPCARTSPRSPGGACARGCSSTSASVSAATTVLGRPVSMPLLVAPVAFQRLVDPDGEVAMARAAAAAGTVMTLSTAATSRPSEIAAEAPPAPRWLQLYCFRDRGVTRALIDEAVESGFEAIVLTVDAPRAGRRERDLRTGSCPGRRHGAGGRRGRRRRRAVHAAGVFDLVDPTPRLGRPRELAGECSVPVLVKGIQTADDGALAVEHGAAAVIVSNHGGRQLDGVAASLDILPEVVEAVGGRCEVLMDGGIRRGTDVVTALGARRQRRARGSRAALGTGGRGRGRGAARARVAARGDRARADPARVPVTGRGDAASTSAPRPYIRPRWRNDTLARRPCAGSTVPGRCSRPRTATSARRSTTRSASSPCTRSG